MHQRLFTLETCCGDQYGVARAQRPEGRSGNPIFMARPARSGRRPGAALCRARLRIADLVASAHARAVKKKRKLFPGRGPGSRVPSLAASGSNVAIVAARPRPGILTGFPFASSPSRASRHLSANA